ncbi:hypothetical protein PG985_002502 [Apiospora marii]|uniref:uncharacterized protein n=1 Tax=Apiospora marii TaxID=335849 RepID=UPI0031318A1D
MRYIIFSLAILCAAAQAEILSFPTSTEAPHSERSNGISEQGKGDSPVPSITAPPSVPVPQSHAPNTNVELRRKRQADVSYLTQVGWTSFIGKFPWPDPSTGPSLAGTLFLLQPKCPHREFAPYTDEIPVLLSPAGWSCQDAVVLESRGSPNGNIYIMCKSGISSQLETWYRNTFAFPHTTTAVVIVDPTSVIIHSVTSTRKRTTTTNDDSAATDGPLPPAGPLQDPFKDSAPGLVRRFGLQGLVAIVANILYVWA